jgi:GT2 family glycosyltransferase
LTLSVIIVNYNVRPFLQLCLCSLRRATRAVDTEVIVVDNGSTDGSVEHLAPLFPEVRFLRTGNGGFARGCNEGLRTASGRYVLFLNPDTVVAEDSLLTAVRFLEAHPGAGGLGVRMVDGCGRFLRESKRSFPAPLTSLFKLGGLAALFPRSHLFARYHLGHLDDRKNHAVDVLAGAFLLLPKKVLDQVGSFDEQFFMYGEDIDLSYRVQQAGYTNYYLADTAIIHFKGESTKKGSLNYVRLFYQAMSIFVRKHYSGSRAGLFRALLQGAIWMRAALSAGALLLPGRRRAPLPETTRVLVAAGPEGYASVLRFLKVRGKETTVAGRLEPDALDTLSGPARAARATELLFDTASVPFKEMIRTMQAETGLRYRFFTGDMIIGSDSSESSGEVLV